MLSHVEEPVRVTVLYKFVYSAGFLALPNFVILVKFVQSFLALDYQMPQVEGTESDFTRLTKPILLGFYSMELLCMLCVHRFFFNDDWTRKCFGFILIMQFLFGRCMESVVEGCTMMKGKASAIDVHMFAVQVKAIHKSIQRLAQQQMVGQA